MLSHAAEESESEKPFERKLKLNLLSRYKM